jgi:hypothetical protein
MMAQQCPHRSMRTSRSSRVDGNSPKRVKSRHQQRGLRCQPSANCCLEIALAAGAIWRVLTAGGIGLGRDQARQWNVAGLGVGGSPGRGRDKACAQKGVDKIAARVNANRWGCRRSGSLINCPPSRHQLCATRHKTRRNIACFENRTCEQCVTQYADHHVNGHADQN